MGYGVGDTVVSMHHGTGVVHGTQRRQLNGRECDYLVLKMTVGDLTMLVPADSCEAVGLRDVVDADDVEGVLDVLRDTHGERKGSWSRRFKENAERLRSGDVFKVAEVVRNLSVRAADGSISTGERRMLGTARELLLAELSVAMGLTEDEVDEQLRALMFDAPTRR